MVKDYYETLGVSKNAPNEDIQKAYRKMCKKYHPDVSSDPDKDIKMKEINEAYENLSDNEKRKKYDCFGNMEMGNIDSSFFDNIKNNHYGSFFNTNEVDDDLNDLLGGSSSVSFSFGGNSMSSDFVNDLFNNARERCSKRSTYKLKVTLEEIYNSTKKKNKIKK